MNVSLRIEQNIIRLDIAMDDALAVDVIEGASKFGNPEPDAVLCEAFSRDMKTKVSTSH